MSFKPGANHWGGPWDELPSGDESDHTEADPEASVPADAGRSLRSSDGEEDGEEYGDDDDDDDDFDDEDFEQEPRTLDEIREAQTEFFDKVWYGRKLVWIQNIFDGIEEAPRGGIATIRGFMSTVESKYGRQCLQRVDPWNDWEWGFLHGKLSALRWVLGSDWDFLDT